jgi:hypothetical protein
MCPNCGARGESHTILTWKDLETRKPYLAGDCIGCCKIWTVAEPNDMSVEWLEGITLETKPHE